MVYQQCTARIRPQTAEGAEPLVLWPCRPPAELGCGDALASLVYLPAREARGYPTCSSESAARPASAARSVIGSDAVPLHWFVFSRNGMRAENAAECEATMNFFFESRILTCLTHTSRRGSQHRGQTSEQEDTKARKAKLQRPRTAAQVAQGSLSHKQQAKQANKGPDRTLEL